jgi:hypothetical protein
MSVLNHLGLAKGLGSIQKARNGFEEARYEMYDSASL